MVVNISEYPQFPSGYSSREEWLDDLEILKNYFKNKSRLPVNKCNYGSNNTSDNVPY